MIFDLVPAFDETQAVAGAPAGFIYLTDPDGVILTDGDGAFLMEAS